MSASPLSQSAEATLRMARAEFLHALRSGVLAAHAAMPKVRAALRSAGAWGAGEKDAKMLYALVALGLIDRNTLLPSLWTEVPLIFDTESSGWESGCLLRVVAAGESAPLAQHAEGGLSSPGGTNGPAIGVSHIEAIISSEFQKCVSAAKNDDTALATATACVAAARAISESLELPLVRVRTHSKFPEIASFAGADVDPNWESDIKDPAFSQPPRVSLRATMSSGASAGGHALDMVSARPVLLDRGEGSKTEAPEADDAGDAERSVLARNVQEASHDALRGFVRAASGLSLSLTNAWPEQVDQVLPYISRLAASLHRIRLPIALSGVTASGASPRRTLRLIASTFKLYDPAAAVISPGGGAQKRARTRDDQEGDEALSGSGLPASQPAHWASPEYDARKEASEDVIKRLEDSLGCVRAAAMHLHAWVHRWNDVARVARRVELDAVASAEAASLRITVGQLALSDARALRASLLARKEKAHAALEAAVGKNSSSVSLLDAIAADEAAKAGGSDEAAEEPQTLSGLLRSRQDAAERATLLETTVAALEVDDTIAKAAFRFARRVCGVAAALRLRSQASLQRGAVQALLAADAALSAALVALLRACDAISEFESEACAEEVAAEKRAAEAEAFYGDAAPALRARLEQDAQSATSARVNAGIIRDGITRAVSNPSLLQCLYNAPLELRLSAASRCSALLVHDAHAAFDPLLLPRRFRESAERAAALRGVSKSAYRVPSALRHMSALVARPPASAALFSKVGWRPCVCGAQPCRVLPRVLHAHAMRAQSPQKKDLVSDASLAAKSLRVLAGALSRASPTAAPSSEETSSSTSPGAAAVPHAPAHVSLYDEGGLLSPGAPIPDAEYAEDCSFESGDEDDEVVEVVPSSVKRASGTSGGAGEHASKRARDENGAAVVTAATTASSDNSDSEQAAPTSSTLCAII